MNNYNHKKSRNISFAKSEHSTNSFSTLDFRLLKTIFGYKKNISRLTYNIKRNKLDKSYIINVKNYFEAKNKGFALFLKRFIKARKSLKPPKKEKKNFFYEDEQLLSFENVQRNFMPLNQSYLSYRYFNQKKHNNFLNKIHQCIKIQSAWRSYNFRKSFFNLIQLSLNETAMKSIVKIQTFIRGKLATKRIKGFLIFNKIAQERVKNENVIENIIEQYYYVNKFKFDYLLEKLLSFRKKCVCRLQSFYRMKIAKNKISKLLRQIKSNYTLIYPFYCKKVQIKVYIFMNNTLRFSVRTYDFEYNAILNTFILFIKYTDFDEGKYRCQLIVDGEVTCDGRFPHTELTDGKFYNLINFTKTGIIFNNENDNDSVRNINYSASEEDFEVLSNKSFCNGIKYDKSNDSSYEELRTNLESNVFTSQMEFIKVSSLQDLVNFD